MRGAERNSAFCEIVRHVRRAGEILRGGFLHALYVQGNRFEHFRIDGQAVFYRLFRVEEALLVLL